MSLTLYTLFLYRVGSRSLTIVGVLVSLFHIKAMGRILSVFLVESFFSVSSSRLRVRLHVAFRVRLHLEDFPQEETPFPKRKEVGRF